ncbi:hypothetical protein LZD49_34255 [Dyadobacter sp. CY261]|uniref:hypothetical protein n=1 Tax=Dyadobacter sp. CY261 TaxID=2907203 RepID=UPI001F17CC5C|nr:hypothetical protein [Dyadobacter sp. CY261]MCF0075586.1 hypothetical protein [Dyadobacter sp. CY261]
MFKKLLISAFILSTFVYHSAFSQDESSKEVSIKSWEIGVDLLPLIDKEKNNFNVILRKNYGNKSVRLRPIFNSQFSPSPIGNSNFENKRVEFGFFIGNEWRKKVSSRMLLFYGAEIGYSKARRRDAVLADTAGSSQYERLDSKQLNILGNIFIGPKFFITKDISFSIETNIGTKWRKGKIDSDRYRNNPNGGSDILVETIRTENSKWYKDYKLIPLYSINLNYQF